MKLNNIAYLLKEGIRGIFTHGFMSFAAVCVTVACLVIVGSFSLLTYNVSIMVEELNQTIAGNVDFACDYIEKHFDGVKVSKPQGTYMLFINCAGWLEQHGKTMDELLNAGWDVGVVWQDGRAFHGKTHIRLNLALPLSRVQEAFHRLDKYVFNA